MCGLFVEHASSNYQNIIESTPQYSDGDKMALIDIPSAINVAVAIGISVLAIIMLYFTLIVSPKQLELGEKEETVLYGKNTKPIHGGTYWQIYRSFDRAFHSDK